MQKLTCPSCRTESPGQFKFCGQCGVRLSVESDSGQPAGEPGSEHRVERRQLTVLFCDLVGSTELSQQLDPEDLRRVIRTYQQACEPVIEAFGGNVSRFLGDGILAFFGYPIANEDDAERAVHAGLGMIDSIASVDWAEQSGQSLSVAIRIGIATGVVVAGDLIGKDAAAEEAVVGETPNLAARLQSLAEPNTVMIGERTRRLIAGRFALTSTGSRELKGFSKPVEVWRVDSVAGEPTRFESMRVTRITPLVNRQHEIDLLSSRWELCKSGKGQVIMITGEAGIGKSRIAEAMREKLEPEPHYFLQYQCSPYHVNTALYPITSHLVRAARFQGNDSDAIKRVKLRKLFRFGIVPHELVISAYATLLSIPNSVEDEFEQFSAKAKKRAINDSLLARLFALSEMRPILALVEDVHWSDPSSRELFQRFSRDAADRRIMVLMTCRSDGAFPDELFPGAEPVHLSRLESDHSRDLVALVASGPDLPAELVGRIVDKADGIPLFAEELTKTLLTKSRQRTGNYELPGVIDDSEIPDTLHDLLMARLDQLGPGKRVAQIASVIGRDFNYDVVASIADIGEPELHEGLDRLAKSDVIIAEGCRPDSSYRFKHALVRDTAYGSLLREERRELHGRTAAALEATEAAAAPELVARHYTEARAYREAVEYWLKAGESGNQRSAYREAVTQLQSGLQLLRRQPDSAQRDIKLLRFLITLGPALIALRGSAAAETIAVYQEAVVLTEKLPESEDHFTALWGWWRISGNFHTDAERATKLEELAARLDDDGLKLQAHHCQWATRFHLGDHGACLQHIQAGIALYGGSDYRSHAARYGGHDPRVCALGEEAQSLWLTGFPNQALTQMRKARVWAEELKQAGSLVHVMDMNLLLLRYRCEPHAAAEQADELIAFAKANEFPEYLAKAKAFKGWSMAKRGQSEEGIQTLRDCIALYDGIGTDEDPPVWLEMLADCYVDLGEFEAGLDAVKRAFLHTEQSGLRFWEAELHRRHGELLWQMDSKFQVEARSVLEKAIQLSISQGARSLQLRSTVTLVQCLKGHEDLAEARDRLTSIVDELDDAHGTPDYTEALSLTSYRVES